MKTLRFEAVCGASGDMILAALIGLGADRATLVERLRALSIDPFELETQPAESHGLRGLRARVALAHHKGHHHAHRGLSDILSIIRPLPDAARAHATAVFQRLAEAEARVHGTTPDRIHFHEVGAMDSIVDIVGACLALDMLGVETLTFAPLPMGHGTIRCAHGTMPNPAPATVELLQGAPVRHIDEPHETVTPTAAALLTGWNLGPASARDAATLEAAAYGIGHTAFTRHPNALRAILLADDAAARDTVLELTSNIDDETPALLGVVSRQLMEAGALDVLLTPVQMKKQRPGIQLTVLARPEDRERMLDLLFTETTTLGVREALKARAVLARRFETLETPYGPVRIKIASWKNRDTHHMPEMADCERQAALHGVPVRKVYEAAQQAVNPSTAAAIT